MLVFLIEEEIFPCNFILFDLFYLVCCIRKKKKFTLTFSTNTPSGSSTRKNESPSERATSSSSCKVTLFSFAMVKKVSLRFLQTEFGIGIA